MTISYTPKKAAKVTGQGQKNKFVAFDMPGVKGIIVAEFVKVVKSTGQIHVKACDDGELIKLDDGHQLWAITQADVNKWKKSEDNWVFKFSGEAKLAKSTPVAKVADDEDAVRIVPDHSRYEKLDYETASGRPGYVSTQDEVGAEILYGQTDLDQWAKTVVKIAKQNKIKTFGKGAKQWDITIENIKSRYQHLNHGLQRMNCGNLIRGILSRSEAEAA